MTKVCFGAKRAFLQLATSSAYLKEYEMVRKSAALVVCVAFLMGMCVAQSSTGTLAGTVTDSTGAVVPNATVTATPAAGGEAKTAKSGGAGE